MRRHRSEDGFSNGLEGKALLGRIPRFRRRGISVGMAGKRALARTVQAGGVTGNNCHLARWLPDDTAVTALWRPPGYSRDAAADSATTPSCLLPGTR